MPPATDTGREGAAAGLDLVSLGASLGRRAGWIALCVVLATVASVGLALLQEKRYTTSASLLFRDPGLDRELFGGTTPTTDQSREGETNLQLVSLGLVADRTARRLGGGLTAEEVSSRIVVSAQGESDLVTVEATDTDPRMAAFLANTFSTEYIAYRRQSEQSAIRRAQRQLEGKLGALSGGLNRRRREALEARAQDLDVLASLQTGGVELAQRASAPTSPSSPKPLQNALIGAFGGLLVGLALALLLEQLDRRLKRPEDLEAVFGMPLLGTVPRSSALSSSGAVKDLPPAEADAFRLLSANLRYFNVDRELKSLLITSAELADGKTTVALNLALAAGDSGLHVLLLEADLRLPSLARALRLSAGRPGLTSLLSDPSIDYRDLQPSVAVAWGERASASPPARLDVVTAGPIPPNPTDLLNSQRMRDLLHSAEREYDLVIIDTPPAAIIADAIPLMQEVSGVLVVSRLGGDTRDVAQRLRDQLQNVHAPVLGVVANFAPAVTNHYGYYQQGAAVPTSAPVDPNGVPGTG